MHLLAMGGSFYYFLFALSAPWHVGFLSTFQAGVFNSAFQPGAP